MRGRVSLVNQFPARKGRKEGKKERGLGGAVVVLSTISMGM